MDFKTVLGIVSRAINNSGIIKNCEDFFINRYSKKIDYYRLYCAGVVLTKELQDIGQWDKKDNVETVYDRCLNALKTPKSKNMTREEWNEVYGEIDKNENIKKALVFLKYLFNNFSKYSEMAGSATNYGFWGTAYSLVAYLEEKYPAINKFTEEMNQHTYFAIISNFADIEKSWNEFIKNNIWDDLEGIDIKSDAGENAKILATKMYADNRIMSELCYSIKDARNTCVHAENGYRDSVMAPAFQGACLSMIEALSVDDEVKQRNKEETLIKLGKIIENNTRNFEQELQKIRKLVNHISKISYFRGKYTSSWTIKNEELDDDIYLQAGKEENKVYIFKIRGKIYKIDNFAINDERFYGKKWAKPNPNKRDIIIDLNSLKEQRKEDNPVDFSKRLWKTIDFANKEIIDNPNYDENDI